MESHGTTEIKQPAVTGITKRTARYIVLYYVLFSLIFAANRWMRGMHWDWQTGWHWRFKGDPASDLPRTSPVPIEQREYIGMAVLNIGGAFVLAVWDSTNGR